MTFQLDVYTSCNYHLAGQTRLYTMSMCFLSPYTNSHPATGSTPSSLSVYSNDPKLTTKCISSFFLQINPNSKAYVEGIKVGDFIESLNGQNTEGLLHNDVQQLIKIASGELALGLKRWVIEQALGCRR